MLPASDQWRRSSDPFWWYLLWFKRTGIEQQQIDMPKEHQNNSSNNDHQGNVLKGVKQRSVDCVAMVFEGYNHKQLTLEDVLANHPTDMCEFCSPWYHVYDSRNFATW